MNEHMQASCKYFLKSYSCLDYLFVLLGRKRPGLFAAVWYVTFD